METPSAECATLMIFVQVALEALVDMTDIFYTRRDQNFARFRGAFSAATNKDHRRTTAFDVTTNATQHKLADFLDEVRINIPVGFVDPGYVNSTLGMTDKKKFHIGPDIHQYSTGIVFQYFKRLLG